MTEPLCEVKNRTVVILAKTHEDNRAALKLAEERGIYSGSCTGIGLSVINLLCTDGEAGTYGYDLRWEHGVENKVIFDTDSPRRPSSWREPFYRANWEKVGESRKAEMLAYQSRN